MTEKQIQNQIIREFATDPRMRLWRQNTGVAKYGQRIVRFGLPGAADLSGILPDGRRLEIEVKTNTGQQSEQQQKYQAMIEKFNGVYILARSARDVHDVLDPIIGGTNGND